MTARRGWRRLYDWFMLPHRIAAIRPHVRASRPRVLDVGCGNHSPRITKRYLPHCEYHGADNGRWNLDEEDERCMDRFFRADLNDPGSLAAIPDAAYDAVICSHVLEHLREPLCALERIAGKVKPGGALYVEVPSPRSLRLPRAHDGWFGVRGCLSFYDDETHVALVPIASVADVLRKNGFTVSVRPWNQLTRRILLLPLYVGAALVVKRFVPASLLWDVTGFASAAIALRATGSPR